MEKELAFNINEKKKISKFNKILNWFFFWRKKIDDKTQVISQLNIKTSNDIIKEVKVYDSSLTKIKEKNIVVTKEKVISQVSSLKTKVDEIIEKEKWSDLEYVISHGYQYTNDQVKKIEDYFSKNYNEFNIDKDDYFQFKKFNSFKLNLPESFKIKYFLTILNTFSFYYYLDKLQEKQNINKNLYEIESDFINFIKNEHDYLENYEELFFLFKEAHTIFNDYKNVNEIIEKVLDEIDKQNTSKQQRTFKSFVNFFIIPEINNLNEIVYERVWYMIDNR